MYKRSIEGWGKHWDFILLDTICLQIAFLLAYFYRFHAFTVYSIRSAYRTSGFVLLVLGIMVAISFGTMNNVLRRSIWEELISTMLQCILVFAIIVILLFSSKDSDHVSRIVMYVTVCLYAGLSFCTRLIYKSILIRHKKLAKNRSMLLVGDRAGIEQALKAFEEHPEAGIDIRGLVILHDTSGQDKTGTKDISGIPVVAEEGDAGHYIRNEWIDEVYIAVADSTLTPSELIAQCAEMAVTVHQQMFTGAEVQGKQWVEKIAKQPVLTTSISIPRPRQLLVKRVVDIIAGALLCIASIIVLLIVTPIIKIASPGPVLLKHERIGQNGKKFSMYTIRAMYMDADKRINEWYEKHPDERPELASDPRFIGNKDGKTGIGVAIRRLGLDELPKGFCILLGSMSLVGTRAPSVEEWESYEFRHRARLACKPGLTGLWQASGKSRTMSFEEATELDTEYIANWSLELDWSILFKTIAKK